MAILNWLGGVLSHPVDSVWWAILCGFLCYVGTFVGVKAGLWTGKLRTQKCVECGCRMIVSGAWHGGVSSTGRCGSCAEWREPWEDEEEMTEAVKTNG